MSYNKDFSDPEKNAGFVADKEHSGSGYDDGAVPGESFEYGNSMYAKIQRLAGKFHVEQRGIERVPEDERDDAGFRALLNVSTMVSERRFQICGI